MDLNKQTNKHTHTHTPLHTFFPRRRLRSPSYAANFERALLCEYCFVLDAF